MRPIPICFFLLSFTLVQTGIVASDKARADTSSSGFRNFEAIKAEIEALEPERVL